MIARSEIRSLDGSILIRPMQTEDIEASYEAVRESIAEISQWMDWCDSDYSMEDAATWVNSCVAAWSNGAEYEFAIIDARNGRFIGACGLNNFDTQNNWANLGYWVRSSETRRGERHQQPYWWPGSGWRNSSSTALKFLWRLAMLPA